MKRERAFWWGVKDGFAEPMELSVGMSWPFNQDANEAYDEGVNLGQIVGWLIRPRLWFQGRPQPWSAD